MSRNNFVFEKFIFEPSVNYHPFSGVQATTWTAIGSFGQEQNLNTWHETRTAFQYTSIDVNFWYFGAFKAEKNVRGFNAPDAVLVLERP